MEVITMFDKSKGVLHITLPDCSNIDTLHDVLVFVETIIID